MIPKPPPREGQLGFLYIPPFRVQGLSVAGEITSIQIPELDICFDMGACPRAALASRNVAVSHGHMDHIGGLAYYCSQRRFQGMGNGRIICDARIAPAVQRMMAGFVDLEQQKTPFDLVPLSPDQQFEIKNNIFIRGFPTEHTAPSFGYSIIEKRSKLKPEFVDLPQEKLKELKDRGVEITRLLEIPLIAYLGDTQPGPHLVREDVRKAQVVISECTFFEPDHKDRAKIGMHLHVDDVAEWLGVLECQALVLIHVSRRTDLGYARKRLGEVAGPNADKVLFLMDHRAARARYEKQAADAEAREAELARRAAPPA
ncbi:MAG: ribonuclease Z [Phycisphaerales bacterium]|nr:ribonuclease Z [Phycisphaerales bacterium]